MEAESLRAELLSMGVNAWTAQADFESMEQTDAVLFLLGSDFIAGQVIFVDGGMRLKERSDGSNYHQ